MNQSFFKQFATHTTHPLLKLKHPVLLVMYSAYIMPLVSILTTNTTLPLSSFALTGEAFYYSGHARALYQQQGPCSVLLVLYNVYNAFCCNVDS